MAQRRNGGSGSPVQQLAPLDHLPDEHAPAQRGGDCVPEMQARAPGLRWPHQPEAPGALKGLGTVWHIVLFRVGLSGAESWWAPSPQTDICLELTPHPSTRWAKLQSSGCWGRDDPAPQPGEGRGPSHSVLPSPAGPREPLAGPPGQKVLSSGVGWGSVCEVSRVLSWLSLRAPGPHAILCRSHVQMWLAGLSVDGTQAWQAPACLVLHPPVPMTVQPLGGVGGRYGNEKGSEVVAQHSHGGTPCTLVSAHSDAGDGGATGWTMLTVGSQMAWSGECRRLKVELFPAEAREDSTEKWLGGHGSRRRGHHGLEGTGRKPGKCARSSLEDGSPRDALALAAVAAACLPRGDGIFSFQKEQSGLWQ